MLPADQEGSGDLEVPGNHGDWMNDWLSCLRGLAGGNILEMGIILCASPKEAAISGFESWL